MILLVSSQALAKKGAYVQNQSGETISVRIDAGKKASFQKLGSGKKIFLATKSYGNRGIYWKTSTYTYASKKYKWPQTFTIKKNGAYSVSTKSGGFFKGKTYNATAKGKKIDTTKPKPKQPEPEQEQTPPQEQTTDFDKLYEALKEKNLLNENVIAFLDKNVQETKRLLEKWQKTLEDQSIGEGRREMLEDGVAQAKERLAKYKQQAVERTLGAVERRLSETPEDFDQQKKEWNQIAEVCKNAIGLELEPLVKPGWLRKEDNQDPTGQDPTGQDTTGQDTTDDVTQ